MKTITSCLVILFSLFIYFCIGKDLVPLNRRILENKASGSCLTVTEDYKLFLDTCNYDLEESHNAGVYSIVRHNLGGHLMRWRTGPIPGAIEGCLQALKPKKPAKVNNEDEGEEDVDLEEEDDQVGGSGSKRRGELRLVGCDVRDPTLNWEFERNDTYKYLLKKYPDGPCVAVDSTSQGSGIHALPCDGNDPSQIWRICEDIGAVKCDP